MASQRCSRASLGLRSAREGESIDRRSVLKNAAAVPLTLTLSPAGRAYARLEGVNKPEMLPEGPVRSVLDPADFLTNSEEQRLSKQISTLEK